MTYCETCDHQDGDICGGCETLDGVPIKYSPGTLVYKTARTNADKFRAMSDEELAKTISGDAIYPWCTEEEPCKYESCTDCVLAWLKQEVHDA